MQSTPRPKRPQVVVACNNCRRKKTKVRGTAIHMTVRSVTDLVCFIQCDGLRPSCRTCRVKNIPCSYNAEPDATPIVHLKRQYERLQGESLPTRRFLEALKSSPWPDAVQLLQRLRTTRDVSAALADYRLPPDLLSLSLETDDFGEGPSQAALDDTVWNEGDTSPRDNESETAEFGVGTHLPGHVFDDRSQRSSESPHGPSVAGSESRQL